MKVTRAQLAETNPCSMAVFDKIPDGWVISKADDGSLVFPDVWTPEILTQAVTADLVVTLWAHRKGLLQGVTDKDMAAAIKASQVQKRTDIAAKTGGPIKRSARSVRADLLDAARAAKGKT